MTDQYWSTFAENVGDLHADSPRPGPPWGLCVHMSGRSIIEIASKADIDALKVVVDYYRSAKYSCHYVIGYEGELVQVSADDRRVPHIGVSEAERQAYLRGVWTRAPGLGPDAVARWQAHWTTRLGFKSPQHIFPGRAPNDAYVGVEMLPLLKATPRGLWHTTAQHMTVARLADDLRVRHGWPGWVRDVSGAAVLPQPRLLAHDDLDAWGRWDKQGGWDVGGLRARPRFDWALVSASLTST